MLRKILFVVLALLVPSLTFAQTTTVTGTVKDANGNLYASGTVSAFISVGTGQPLPAGVPASGSIGPFNLTVSGTFSVTVASPFTWVFTVCGTPVNIGPRGNPASSNSVCFSTSPLAISGGTLDITANLPVVPVLGPGGGGGGITSGTSVPATCTGATTFQLTNSTPPTYYDCINSVYILRPTNYGWHRLGTIIGPAIAADQQNLQEPRVIVDTTCPLLPNLLAGETCFRIWASSGWTSGGMAYWESPTSDPFAIVRSATISTTGAHGSVSKCGSTYYMTVANAFSGATHVDLYSSATGNQDWALLQANVVVLGAGGQFDSSQVGNSDLLCAGTLDATSNVYLTYDGYNGTKWAHGITTCSSACFGGAATYTKSGSNPIIAEVGTMGGCEFRLLNGTIVARCHGQIIAGNVPSDLWKYTAASPTGPYTRAVSIPDLQRGTFDEGMANTVGQLAKPNTLDVNGSCYLVYHAGANGNAQSGVSHIKLAVAFTTCAAMALTNGGAVEPDRFSGQEWATINTFYPPPVPGLLIGYGTGANLPGPHLLLQNYLTAGNVSVSLLEANCQAFVGSSPTQTSPTFGCGGLQFNTSATNSGNAAFMFLENTSGTQSFFLQSFFDTGGSNVYDILPPVQTQGTAPTCSSTGSTGPTCAVTTGSTNSAGTITITVGTAPATSGTVTLTFSGGLGTNPPVCIMHPSQLAAGQWNARAQIFDKTPSTASDLQNWDNNNVALTASTAININYECWGK
jgi:hypothetical protein